MYYSAKNHNQIVRDKSSGNMDKYSLKSFDDKNCYQSADFEKITEIIFKNADGEILFADINFNILLQNCHFNFKYDKFNFLSFSKKHFSASTTKKILKFKRNREKHIKITESYQNKKKRIFLEISISKVSDKTNNFKVFFIYIKDISSERLLQVQCETFISTLAHDIKTPAIAQINALKYLVRQKEYSKSEIIKELLSSCIFLNYIIDNLLVMYKNDFHSSIYPSTYCDLGLILYEAADKLKDTLAQKEQTIEIYMKTPNLKPVAAVKKEIEMLITNLLLNAVNNSFSNDKIIVTLENFNNGIKLSIQNFGLGYCKKKLSNFLDEFSNLGNKYQKIAHNLLLKTSKQIADAYGWEITFTTAPDKGTVAEVFLPEN